MSKRLRRGPLSAAARSALYNWTPKNRKAWDALCGRPARAADPEAAAEPPVGGAAVGGAAVGV
jgi:hypothetical protein